VRRVAHKITDTEEKLILSTVNSAEFVDKSPRQIIPLLADRCIYLASEATVYRILGKHGLLAHRRSSKAPVPRKKPGAVVSNAPNQLWSWDITYLKGPRPGSYFYLYLVMDVFSRKIVGAKVHHQESSLLASGFIQEAVLANGVAPGALILHSDNGGPMKGSSMLATLQWLGVTPSFSRPRTSDDNPYSESLFKTLKYSLNYPKDGFESIEDAFQFADSFVKWYNTQHLHSRINWVTPEDRHNGFDIALLKARQQIYEAAKQHHPKRWSGTTRNWSRIDTVTLNPLKAPKIQSVA
jgi:transposase InsO family protein